MKNPQQELLEQTVQLQKQMVEAQEQMCIAMIFSGLNKDKESINLTYDVAKAKEIFKEIKGNN